MQWVYVLWSETLRKRYVGCSENPDHRLCEHNRGRNRFTKGGIPWSIIHRESWPDLVSARQREIFLKKGTGREWLDTNFPQFRRTMT